MEATAQMQEQLDAYELSGDTEAMEQKINDTYMEVAKMVRNAARPKKVKGSLQQHSRPSWKGTMLWQLFRPTFKQGDNLHCSEGHFTDTYKQALKTQSHSSWQRNGRKERQNAAELVQQDRKMG